MPQFEDAVSAFGAAAKERLTVTGDPEAAIRAPLEGLLDAMATLLGRHVVPHSESRLDDLQVRELPSLLHTNGTHWRYRDGELNDMLSVLRRLVEPEPAQAALLGEIVAGPLVPLVEITPAGTISGT